MGLKPTPVRLAVGTAERIDTLVGRNRRAGFIREAVERELERREKAAGGAPQPHPSSIVTPTPAKN